MEAKFVGHHDCRLGKWYDSGNGKKYFSTLPSYAKLEAHHKDVHDNIIAAHEVMKQHGNAKDCLEEIYGYFQCIVPYWRISVISLWNECYGGWTC